MPEAALDIAAAYDHLAERWLDERFSRTNGLDHYRRALGFLAPGGSGWALSIGCGCNTRFNALQREHGLRLEGVDISARMVELARAADPAVELHHADACDWQPARRYRFIAAWDSLWHVPLDRQRELLLSLASWLEPGGVLLFSCGGTDAPAEHTDAAMGPAVYYASLGVQGVLDALAAGACLPRHLEFDQLPEKHLVVIAQRGG